MKADPNGAPAERTRALYDWHTAEKYERQTGQCCEYCCHSDTTKETRLAKLTCLEMELATKPAAICSRFGFDA